MNENDIHELVIDERIALEKIEAPLSSIESLFRETWASYKTQFLTFSGIMLIPALIKTGMGLLINPHDSFIPMIGSLISAFITLWAVLALTYAMKDSKEKIDIIESYKRGSKKILPLLWVSILVAAITSAGFLLFIIPGILFVLWFTFSAIIIVTEDLSGMNAILKSKTYVGDHWLAVFARFFIFGLAIIIVMLPISFLSLFLLKSVMGLYIMNFLILLFITPFASVYRYTLYTQLKKIKGDFTFTVTKKTRYMYAGIVLAGVIMVPIIIFTLLHFFR